ncbi:MAG: trigger factor [Bacteroidota bacterium]
MNITLEKTGDLTADIKLLVEPEDYKDQVTAEIKKQAKNASLPGFRPGKVPFQMVRKMIGKSVVIDHMNKLVSQSLHEYIMEEKLDILGDPMPKDKKTEDDFDPKGESSMEFTFEVGMAPEFDVNLKIKKAPVKYEVKIDDDFLDKEVKIYRDRFGEVSNPEEVEEGDTIFGKLFEVDEKGEAVEGGFEQMLPLSPNRIEQEEIFKPFVGAKLESVHDFNVFDIEEDPEALSKILFIETDVLAQLKEKTIKFEIKRLNRVQLAEINAEFFNKVAETLKWEVAEEEEMDEATFREKLKEELTNNLSESTRVRYQNDLTEALIKQHELSFPDEFLKKWLLATNNERTEEQVEAEYDSFTESLTWTLIEGKLIEQFDVKLEDDELDIVMKKALRRNLAMSMGMDPDENMLNSYLQHAKNDKEFMNRMVRQAITENVFAKLSEELTPKTKDIDATAFVDMINAER